MGNWLGTEGVVRFFIVESSRLVKENMDEWMKVVWELNF